MVSEIRIGIAGWRCGSWRKDFDPEGLRQDGELVTEPVVEPQVPL